MTNLPIRNLGTVGVVTDVDPFNLPFGAFTRAKNVRFTAGKVTRSPIFRNVKDNLDFVPVFVYGNYNQVGYDTVLMVGEDLEVKEYVNGTVFDRSGTITGTTSAESVTGTSLADVTYFNRPDHVPIHRLPTATNFSDLPNWDATWRTPALRSFGDFLVAAGMTEGSTNYPNRVRYSNLTLANEVPDSWDATDTTKSAGFNDLVQMRTPIVDAATLGPNLYIYSSDQVWLMEFVGGTFIFNFRKIFSDAGVINQNCIAEVEGVHYVFDNNDIYVSDGVSRKSIVINRVRDYIFSGLNNAKKDKCFVQHNATTKEIYFCYVSGDDMAVYEAGDGCNRAAVYSYQDDTWSFMDLPSVRAGGSSNVDSVVAYNTVTLPYGGTGGSYYDQEAGFARHTLMVGVANTTDGITSAKLYGIDYSDTGALAFGLDLEALQPPKLERIGIDLDEAQIPLVGYKTINKIIPQLDTVSPSKDFYFQFGASQLPTQSPTYGDNQLFNSEYDYKLDVRQAGRYLSYKITILDTKDFAITGFDLDVQVTGRR